MRSHDRARAQIRLIVREETQDLRDDVAVLKTDVAEMKGDIVSMKGDIHGLKEGLHYQGILAEDTNRKIDIMLEILTATTKKFEKIDPLEGKVDGLQDDHAILKGVVKSHIADKDLHSR